MTVTIESKPDLTEVTYEPKYEIGTLFHDALGGVYKYVKIVFGIYDEGEACAYQWISWNPQANLKEGK